VDSPRAAIDDLQVAKGSSSDIGKVGPGGSGNGVMTPPVQWHPGEDAFLFREGKTRREKGGKWLSRS